MSKRNLEIIETNESRALRRLRIEHGLSIRKLAERMELSPTRVTQMEVGREDIKDPYINKFLAALDMTRQGWLDYLEKEDPNIKLRKDIIKSLNGLNQSKLKIVKMFLDNLN